eukprot:2151412-Alexandrium_andersonii.AAC.1
MSASLVGSEMCIRDRPRAERSPMGDPEPHHDSLRGAPHTRAPCLSYKRKKQTSTHQAFGQYAE